MTKQLFHKSFLYILLITVAGLLTYSNTFNVPFHFDDYEYIVNNQRLKSLTDVPSLFRDIKGPIGPRPVTLASFAMNYYWGGFKTFGYHVFNIMLHLINGALLYLIIIMTAGLLNYSKNNLKLIALFSSLVFISHPVQTECVTYIVGRSTPLITLFYLSGIMFFVKAATSEKRKCLYTICLFLVSILGMASRENFITFPFMLILYDFFFVSRFKIKSVIQHFKVYLPVLMTLVYFAYLVLNYKYEQISFSDRISPLEYLITEFNVHWTYLRLLILPVNLNFDYDYPVSRTLFELPTLFSFVGYTGLWAAGLYLMRKNPVISFCILWFMVTLSPVSSIIPLNNVIFEHRLYLPSIGIFVAIIIFLFFAAEKLKKRWESSDKIVAAALTVIVFILAGTAYARNLVWQDRISMLEDVTLKSPNKVRPHYFLANAYMSRKDFERAVKHYEIAIKLYPYLPDAHYNLGNIYVSKRQFDKALKHYETAVKLNQNLPDAHVNLGNIYASRGFIDKTIEQYQTAIKLNPNIFEAHNNLGIIYQSQGLTDKAIEKFLIARKLNPGKETPYFRLGTIYYNKGDMAKARKELEKSLEINPRNSAALKLLDNIIKNHSK